MLPNRYPIPAQDCIHIAATKTSHLLLKNETNFSLKLPIISQNRVFIYVGILFFFVEDLRPKKRILWEFSILFAFFSWLSFSFFWAEPEHIGRRGDDDVIADTKCGYKTPVFEVIVELPLMTRGCYFRRGQERRPEWRSLLRPKEKFLCMENQDVDVQFKQEQCVDCRRRRVFLERNENRNRAIHSPSHNCERISGVPGSVTCCFNPL